VAARPASGRPDFAHKALGSSADLARETLSKGEPVQCSGSNGANQFPPIRVCSSAREHDFSGSRRTVGVQIIFEE
jgi:hypothetical protein